MRTQKQALERKLHKLEKKFERTPEKAHLVKERILRAATNLTRRIERSA